MSNYDLGKDFEIVTHDFFLWLFKEIDIQVNNNWIQKSGYQFGFDVGFQVAISNENFFKREIYIECKNYEKSILEKSHLYDKLVQLKMSSFNKTNSIFIFLSPKVDLKKCTQDSNPVMLENFFNEAFELKTVILTPDNKIKEIFALNDEIYFRVYGEENLIEINSNEKSAILNYFKNLLISKGEIPNFRLVKELKEFLGEASIVNNNDFYVERKLKTNKFSFFQEDKNLRELLKENDFILLLGEPGSGKTTELKNIAKYFKENIEVLGITPIFIGLSNIEKFDNIENILPSKWDSNNQILLLFDSLDEFEFRSKLSEQIESLLKRKEISFKIVISCRTYSYNEELSFFKPVKFYLDGFKDNQIIEILNNKYNLPVEEYDSINKHKFKDILEDPHMLNRFGLYFKKNKSIPNQINELYYDFISDLNYDEVEVYKIFSLILELTKSISIKKDELRSLFGLKYNKLIKLEFIQKSFDKQSFKFTHKNYQENFAALALSELPYEDIISFIVIPGTNKTHPSLFNTITFLINILESEKCKLLIQWVVENEPKLLFNADRNRVESFRVKVFQEYFYNECIIKAYWINNDKTFSVKEIAEFGDCNENLDFLYSIISDKKYHFRVIISALDLLSYFNINGFENKLKQLFLTKLNDEDTLLGIKSQILICSAAFKFENDSVFFDDVYKFIKEEDGNEINSAFLDFIFNVEDLDSLFEYLLQEFKRIYKIVLRSDNDEVIRGNDWKVSKLILRLKNYNNFINIITYFFHDDIIVNSYAHDNEKILIKCKEFSDKERDFVIILLKSIVGKTNYFTNENLLKQIIQQSNQVEDAVAYLIENELFSKINVFISSFIDEKSLDLIKDRYLKGYLIDVDIERLRYFIWSNNNHELSQKFNDLMTENGFKSEKPFHTKKEVVLIQENQRKKYQLNFDILFDLNLLYGEVGLIFSKYNIDSVNNELITEIETDWYELHGYWNNSIDTSIKFLRNLVYEYGTLSLNKLKEIIFEEDESFYLIESKIEGNKNSNILFTIKEEQILKIKNWTLKKAKEIDFSKVFEFISLTTFRYGRDNKKLKTVLFFVKHFDFEIEKEFLLNCIAFYEMENSQETQSFQFLMNKIDDKDKFDKRIVENILTSDLFSFSLTKHIDYALDNELARVYSKIREFFLLDKYEHNLQNQFAKYVKLTNDFEVLKECANDVKSYKCWTAIKILVDYKKEEKFCCDKAFEYLDLEVQVDNNFLSNSLDVLFEFNRKEAVTHYLSLIKRDLWVSVLDKSFSNYTAVSDLAIIQELFNETYITNGVKFSYSRSSNFLNVYVSNLSKKENMYKRVKSELLKIKEKVTKDVDRGLFFVNFLLDNAKNSYINEKSKKYTFEQALEIVEKIIK